MTLKRAADDIHKAVDDRVSQLDAELERRYSEIEKQNTDYRTKLETISDALKAAHQSCLKGKYSSVLSLFPAMLHRYVFSMA